MKTKLLYSLLLGILISSIYSCKKDDVVPEVKIPEDTISVNKWIYDNMELYYLWNSYLPTDIDYTKEGNPGTYFKKLLYTEKDKWSWITDDYLSLAAEFSGTQVIMGYAPAFYLLADETSIVIVVKYVYPGSAADLAGLKRGDVIISINNTKLNKTNYYNLFSGTSYSVQLGVYTNNTFTDSGKSLNLTAQTTITDPSIYHNVININGTKIGYLVYVEFVSGDNNVFLKSLDNIFAEFKIAGISKLIVDLRYNPGGEINAAKLLASEIAPYSVISSQKILINQVYNDDIQTYFTTHYPEELSVKFTSNATNVNMQTVYFLTTSGTASASELVITGLEPYMNVVQIGESTYGKYTGAFVIPDDKKEWAMVPIVLKYSNASGYTDFVNGLSPDYTMKDNLVGAAQFGDISDPMVAKAISLATGIATKTVRPEVQMPYKQVYPEKMELKKNLFFLGIRKTK